MLKINKDKEDQFRHSNYSMRIYPTPEQEQQILINIQGVQFIYNYCLDLIYGSYSDNNSFIGSMDCYKHLTKLKQMPNTKWLQQADIYALQDAIDRVFDARKNFIEFQKKKEQGILAPKVCFPKYKSEQYIREGSYLTKNVWNGINHDRPTIELVDQYLKLPKIGWIFCPNNLTNLNPGRILHVVVRRTLSNEYYAIINFRGAQYPIYRFPFHLPLQDVGIDSGFKNTLTFSDGNIINFPLFKTEYQDRLSMLQQKMGACVYNSNNYKKYLEKYVNLEHHIANKRKDFIERLTISLLYKYDIFYIEDIYYGNDFRYNWSHKINHKAEDMGLGIFFKRLKEKCTWYGKYCITIPRNFPSTKTCNICNYINWKIDINTREWVCPRCNTKHDRDLNAAVNILKKGREIFFNNQSNI